MKIIISKRILFILPVAFLLAFAYAPQTEAVTLQYWCENNGGTWEFFYQTCRVPGNAAVYLSTLDIGIGQTLYIPETGRILIHGYGSKINNAGTITNYGTINNHDSGIINNQNYGTINNRYTGTINNYYHGYIFNYNIINNSNTIYNAGTITNYDRIENDGTIDNDYIINNNNTFSNDGTIDNDYIINNTKTFRNSGTINNYSGTFNNYDTINNYSGTVENGGTINNNDGTIDNRGIIINNNSGTIDNYDIIFNACTASFINLGTFSGNPIVEEALLGDPELAAIESKITASDAETDDRFGTVVEISGDTAIVGAYRDDDSGENSGSAYIFRYDGSIWVQEAKLTASDGAASDNFASSVSIRGDTAIVAADRDDDSGVSSGSAYVFRYNGSDWIEEAKLTASDAAASDYFGSGVAINGNTAFVGASLDDDSGENSGSEFRLRLCIQVRRYQFRVGSRSQINRQ
jgi:hypothetical protein